jgi:hypothetical protein
VKPLGSFSSPISHCLNQLSFTTDFSENGKTADCINGCIAMVMGSAFEENTFVYDQIYRQDDISHGSMRYPPVVRAAYKKWTKQLLECLEAKVEVVYGKKAMQSLVTDPEVEMILLPLWGGFTGVILYLLHEEYFDNAQEGYKFRRAILSGCHP